MRSERDAPAPPSRSPSPNPLPIPKVAPLSVVDKHSRSRPISSSGPHSKLRPVSSPVPSNAQTRNIRTAPASLAVLDRPTISRRSSAMPTTLQHPIPRSPVLQGRDQIVFKPMQDGSPPQPSNMRFPPISARHSTQPAVSHGHGMTQAQVPISASLNEPMPLLRAPRTANVELQRAVDDITDRVNMLVAHGNATHTLESRQSVQGYVHVQGRGPSLPNTRNGNRQSQGFVHAYGPANFTLPEDDTVDVSDGENKENKDRPYPGGDLMQITGGLFGKRGSGDDPQKSKEKRSRRKLLKHWSMHGILTTLPLAPTLDFHGLHSKRSPIGSPNISSAPGMSVLASPVVDEFKGWFSNLFNWKAQTYVLCSTDDIFTTRNETTRLLERFGVIVALEDTGQLRCRVDDVLDTSTGHVVQKQARFRVELHSATGGTSPLSGGGTFSALSRQNSISPQPNSARHSMSKYMLNGSQCAIVLVQEKGAVSTFRAACRRLREEWTLDTLRSPMLSPDGITRTGHGQRLME